MVFNNTLMQLRRSLLCCRHERKPSLEIGLPTNARRVDISETLLGFTDAERKCIREKASNDAIHLLGLQSQPPSHPPTSASSPTTSRSPFPDHKSHFPSREPSETLPNAASTNLPNILSTPPKQRHNHGSSPTTRTKTMWKASDEQSYSSSSASSVVYTKREQDISQNPLEPSDSFMTLNLEFDCEEDKQRDSPRTLSLNEGFEVQDTTGGSSREMSPVATKVLSQRFDVKTSVSSLTGSDISSEEEEEVFVAVERQPLCKI
ncbi:hypothetical protein GQ44DRAFT_608396 [Phaeosphaeriaceae sp. PMI808]|nr:hypothetical protein GQ44DRAFT_608396 [Phaeosphaeriaceae sp. PMI808]